MKRLFWGIELPKSIKNELSGGPKAKISGAKWVLKNQHHITLIFLGEIQEHDCEKVIELSNSIHVTPFKVRLTGLNFFGPQKSPNVLYLGVEKNKELDDLQKQLVRVTRKSGFHIEKRKFSPHVTLARMNKPDTLHLGQFFEQYALTCFDEFLVSRLTLFESFLAPEGAIYEAIEVIDF